MLQIRSVYCVLNFMEIGQYVRKNYSKTKCAFIGPRRILYRKLQLLIQLMREVTVDVYLSRLEFVRVCTVFIAQHLTPLRQYPTWLTPGAECGRLLTSCTRYVGYFTLFLVLITLLTLWFTVRRTRGESDYHKLTLSSFYMWFCSASVRPQNRPYLKHKNVLNVTRNHSLHEKKQIYTNECTSQTLRRILIEADVVQTVRYITPVVLNLFHCWDPLNATDVVWDPLSKLKKYALRNKV